MFIASQKRAENIAEYILYMWQVEDIIRASNFDIDRIKETVIDKYPLDERQRRELTEWYESLIEMMHREGIESKGHLQINRNILSSLVDLHQGLLADPEFPKYTAAFYKALPFIVELRSKAGDEKPGEIEACFNALYGMLMLRLQKKEISPDTAAAIKEISSFIATLSRYFHLNEAEKLDKEP